MYISTILGELVSCEHKGQLLELASAAVQTYQQNSLSIPPSMAGKFILYLIYLHLVIARKLIFLDFGD